MPCYKTKLECCTREFGHGDVNNANNCKNRQGLASFQEGISSSIREDTESEQIINEVIPYAVEASPDIPHNHVKKQQIIDEDISLTNSSKWYIDWQNAKCVQSCDSPTIVSCGGIITSIHTAYGTVRFSQYLLFYQTWLDI